MKKEPGLPVDLAKALYDFCQETGEIRESLSASLSASAQKHINILANLTAAARAYLPPVLSKHGQEPLVHFVSTIFVPNSLAFVTKNDLILWAGRIEKLGEAGTVGNWPSGSTVHLSPSTYAAFVEEAKGHAVKVRQ